MWDVAEAPMDTMALWVVSAPKVRRVVALALSEEHRHT
jgi:hypothetical protein